MIPALSLEILAYIIIGLIFLMIVLIFTIIKLNNRISVLVRGKQGADLEETIKSIVSDTTKSLSEQTQINRSIKIIARELEQVISGVGVVRFNPFEGSSGSNQSFSVALINKKGDGVIFSSIYSREKVSVFAKPIEKFASTYTLTEEELQALGKARGL